MKQKYIIQTECYVIQKPQMNLLYIIDVDLEGNDGN